VNKVTGKEELLREIFLVVGGQYASHKLSEEAWNYWLELVKLIQEGEKGVSARNFDELYRHYGHQVVLANYTDKEGKVLNVSVECEECYEVLMGYDKEGERSGTTL
jgi:hypothetical protein